MDEYIEDEKKLFDLMSATSGYISSKEQILYLLRGMNLDYIYVITNITQKNIPSIDKVFSHLRKHKRQLARINLVDV